jgi:agmatinase
MQDLLKQIEQGNPSSETDKIFGLPFDENSAKLILLPVPWEPTTSYGSGTSKAPRALISASQQLDLEDLSFSQPYKQGFYLLPEDKNIRSWNSECKQLVEKNRSFNDNQNINKVNLFSEKLNQKVEEISKKHLHNSKLVGLIGGDHSSPFGLIKALAAKEKNFGILHIDAHFDLRKSYEGFKCSHASIMYNVLEQIPEVKKISHVGIRDFCNPEKVFSENSNRSKVWYDSSIQSRILSGENFAQITAEIIDSLPDKVYISFDIDGLDPTLCPSTGTPVPGGLSFAQACFITEKLAHSGKKIIGFDLCEVTPSSNEWDANVASRILYKLCGAILHTNK